MDKHPVLKNIWCANAWVGAPWACGDDHHNSQENFEVDVLDMYENNTIENYEYETGCPHTKCANYCSQIRKDACESHVEAARGVDPSDSSTYPGTVKRCRWNSDNKMCEASSADTCDMDKQGTKKKGYSCNDYYPAKCGKYIHTDNCKKFKNDQTKCDKHYSVSNDDAHLCNWIPNSSDCQNGTGNRCVDYAYCPSYGCQV